MLGSISVWGLNNTLSATSTVYKSLEPVREVTVLGLDLVSKIIACYVYNSIINIFNFGDRST